MTTKPAPQSVTVSGDSLVGFVKALPWSRFLRWGTVKVKVQDGKPTLVTVETNVKIE